MCDSERTTCPYCGDVLTNPRRVWCGKASCKKARDRDRIREFHERVKRETGKAYKPPSRAHGNPHAAVYEHTCPWCGKVFRNHKPGRQDGRPCHCSVECWRRARQKAKMQVVLHPSPSCPLPLRHPALREQKRSRRFVACTCVICGTSFLAISVRHSTCGDAACVAEKRRAERRSRKAYERSLARGGRPGVFSGAQWGERLREFDHRCAYCGESGHLEIEHVIPISRGGANTIANVVPSCRACNVEKSTMTPDEWKATDGGRVVSLDTSRWPKGALATG